MTADRPNPNSPRFVRDASGKRASVRRSASPADEVVGRDAVWTWLVDRVTGRYYVVAR